MESFLKVIDNLLQHATFIRVMLVSVLLVVSVAALTLYENRQKVYDDFSMSKMNGDFILKEPTPRGYQILSDLASKYPEIALISLIDADPVANTRRVVARVFIDKHMELVIKAKTTTNPTVGDGPLFGSDALSNKQVLAIMNGEFSCDPVAGGILATVFAEAAADVKMSCRVPLPPAFNKATGWFTIHTKELPKEKLERLKFDALSTSLMYYNSDIAVRGSRD